VRSGTRRTADPLGRRGLSALMGLAAVLAATSTVASAGPTRADTPSDIIGVVTTATDTTDGLVQGAAWGYSPSQTSLRDVAAAIGADGMYSHGFTGRGVGVALVDTGLVPATGLNSGNVVNGPDLSFDSQSKNHRNLDGFGHGTHMAGIIAGRDATDGSGFRGIAPEATLTSIRVGASDGSADVSQVVAALDWVVAHRNDAGAPVRVLNLSYGTDGTQDILLDPIAHAVENAWRAGIVVVVSGGNKGRSQPYLDNPAVDPYVLAVGADDTHGSSDAVDDTVPGFSSRGSSSRRVDVVAPGQSIVSLRNRGSVLDTEYPAARVGDRFFKGSGTSQAAAVVSGAAALLLQQRPELTPDQVKSLLVQTAHPLALADLAGSGAGLVDLSAASATPAVALTRTWPRSTGLGSLESARGTVHVGNRTSDLVGEFDIFGRPWDAAAWAAASSAGTAWSGGTWNGNSWTGTCWCGTSWAPKTWSSQSWSSQSWSGTGWSSQSWSSQIWSSQSWSGTGWSSQSWSSQSWSSQSWSGASYGSTGASGDFA